jgi:hypothetical protein
MENTVAAGLEKRRIIIAILFRVCYSIQNCT